MYCKSVKCVLCIDNWTENLNWFELILILQVASGCSRNFGRFSTPFHIWGGFQVFGFTVMSHAMASYQDASWRLHRHILLFSSLYDGPVLHNSQVRELVNTIFRCHQGSLRAAADSYSRNSSDWGWTFFRSNTVSSHMTLGVDLVETSCSFPKSPTFPPQRLSQLFEMELYPALERLWY